MVLPVKIIGDKKSLFVIFCVIFFTFIFALPAFAQPQKNPTAAEAVRAGLDDTAKYAELEIQEKGSLPTLIGRGIAALLSLIAVLFFVLTIYGGIMWMLARGNEDMTKKAKDTIMAAIAGIIVVMGSYAITTFVLNSVEDQAEAPGVSGGGSGTSGTGTPQNSQVCCARRLGTPTGGVATTYSVVEDDSACARVCSSSSVQAATLVCQVDRAKNPPLCQ